ncbi:MAG: dephospho-CoA kinase [Capnocytophaga sp.]|nr:dephospho-CoA kinase [Capnocytophaga sp.]
MIVGITGGIGSGKTTVAKMFAEYGIPLYFSDKEAIRIIEEDGSVKLKLVNLFGEQAYTGGIYNRKYIAGIVFSDKEKLQQLNAIVHPAIGKDFLQWYERQRSPYVIKEAAILFESGLYKDCDAIITVTSPEPIRVQRVMQRDGIDENSVRRRMANQWTDSQRIRLSDFVIENSNIDDLRNKVEEIHLILIKKMNNQ